MFMCIHQKLVAATKRIYDGFRLRMSLPQGTHQALILFMDLGAKTISNPLHKQLRV